METSFHLELNILESKYVLYCTRTYTPPLHDSLNSILVIEGVGIA